MFTVAAISAFAVYCAYVARNEANASFLKVSFIVIYLLLALRYNYGNDYQAYYEGFSAINGEPSIRYFGGDVRVEAGWIFLCRLFKPFGFYVLIAVMALFQCMVYYRVIVKYVMPRYYWFAVFYYAFNPSIMLIHQSAMRQSIAIAMFVLSVESLYRKNLLRYCAYIAVAALFHKSALVLLPLALLGLFNWRLNAVMALALVGLYLYLFRVRGEIVSALSMFVVMNVRDYASYLRESGVAPGLGVALYSVLLAFIVFYAKYSSREHLLLTKIGILHFLCIPIALLESMASRIVLYFTPFLVVVFPHLFGNMRHVFARRTIVALIVLHTLYSYHQFMTSETYSEAFGRYQTIFSR